HLSPVVHLDLACCNLAVQRAIRAKEKLLPGLPASIKRSGNLSSTERAVIEQAAVFTCKGNTLCNTLINDIYAHFSEAIHVAFTSAVVAAFHGVIKQAIDAIAIVPVILGSVDASLSGNTVRTPRAVLKAECLDVIPHLSE